MKSAAASSPKPALSILALTKDEAPRLPDFFAALKPLRLAHEVVLVDSGSRDQTRTLGARLGGRILKAPLEASRPRATAPSRMPGPLDPGPGRR